MIDPRQELLAIRAKIDKDLLALELANRALRTEREALVDLQLRLENLKAAQALAQQVAQQVQESAHAQISEVVSRCLSAVFDDPYEFKIKFIQRRGKTEAELVFLRNGMEVDPMEAAGGGVVDVASFALRLACLLLSKPPLRPVLILDEPFKFVSVEYRERIRALLVALSREMGVQIIMVSHMRELQIGRVFEL